MGIRALVWRRFESWWVIMLVVDGFQESFVVVDCNGSVSGSGGGNGGGRG